MGLFRSPDKEVAVVVKITRGAVEEVLVFKDRRRAESYYVSQARKHCGSLANYQDFLGLGILRTEYHLRYADLR